MTLPCTGAAKRGILIVALIVASSTELLAQGTSPWLQAIDVLQQAFTGPIARGLSLIAIVVGGLMFRDYALDELWRKAPQHIVSERFTRYSVLKTN